MALSCTLQYKETKPHLIKVIVPERFSGPGYLVASSSEPSNLLRDGEFYLNEQGVAYIGDKALQRPFKIDFYLKDQLLTESEVKFLFMTEEERIKKRILLFYILSPKEWELPEYHWDIEDNRREIRRKMFQVKDTLISKGAIR